MSLRFASACVCALFALGLAMPGSVFARAQAAQPASTTPAGPAGPKARAAASSKIAVVVDGPAESYDQIVRTLAAEINPLLSGRYPKWAAPSVPNFVGDFSQDSARIQVEQALADPKIGMVIGVGLNVGRAVAEIAEKSGSLQKPVLLPFTVPHIQKLPAKEGKSGVHNLGYLTGVVGLRNEFERFAELTRKTQAVFLLDQHYLSGYAGIAKDIQRWVGKVMKVRVIGATATAQETLARLPKDAQAVYLGPLLRMPSSEYPKLVEGLNTRKLPTYASEGRAWVQMGALMSIVPDDDVQRRMRRIALYVDATLGGEDPAGFSTKYSTRSVLLINEATARRIGVSPSFSLLNEAELVGSATRAQSGPRLDLKAAVARALVANRDLNTARVQAGIAKNELLEATAGLFPTATLQANYTQVLPESKSMMSFARTGQWGANLNIPLYSAMAWANRRHQQRMQRATAKSIATNALDVVAQTATAYLNVLRAQNAEEINRQNLTRIRRNLAMAKVRVELGAAGRQEVFRWEIEIAEGSANVIKASAMREQARIELNRQMNQALEAPVTLQEPAKESLGLVVDPRLAEFVADPFSFRVLREFMVRESIANSPEIQQLDATISGMTQLQKGQKHSLWIPNVFATASMNHTFYLDGIPAAFQMPPPVPGQPAGGGIEFPKTPIWNIGAGLSWTGFDFTRNARIRQTSGKLKQMQRQRAAVSQKIEQRVRSAMHQAGASSAVVQLRSNAAKSARENVELVSDAYSKGSVGVITLVDAQNQALQTELAAVNAQYDWLVDFIEVQRASGAFSFLQDNDTRDAFLARLKQFARHQR